LNYFKGDQAENNVDGAVHGVALDVLGPVHLPGDPFVSLHERLLPTYAS
jgi:hypothetical protein